MSDTDAEFAGHANFEREDGAFAPTTNDFEATVDTDDGTVHITVTLPTLDASTTEPVADVVEDGWYDTFERRVADAPGVTKGAYATEPSVERTDDEVTVGIELTPSPGNAADDALAIVNYVEGTWFQGIIPGYDYVDDVQAMRERAAQNAN
jgi:hypothetical protein